MGGTHLRRRLTSAARQYVAGWSRTAPTRVWPGSGTGTPWHGSESGGGVDGFRSGPGARHRVFRTAQPQARGAGARRGRMPGLRTARARYPDRFRGRAGIGRRHAGRRAARGCRRNSPPSNLSSSSRSVPLRRSRFSDPDSGSPGIGANGSLGRRHEDLTQRPATRSGSHSRRFIRRQCCAANRSAVTNSTRGWSRTCHVPDQAPNDYRDGSGGRRRGEVNRIESCKPNFRKPSTSSAVKPVRVRLPPRARVSSATRLSSPTQAGDRCDRCCRSRRRCRCPARMIPASTAPSCGLVSGMSWPRSRTSVASSDVEVVMIRSVIGP